MPKRLLAVVVMAGLLMGAKAPEPPSSLTITTPIPTLGQVLDYTYVASGLKPYEYPVLVFSCAFPDTTGQLVTFWQVEVYPTIDPPMPLILGGGASPNVADCQAFMYAFGGNRTHPGFGRYLVEPFHFVGAASP